MGCILQPQLRGECRNATVLSHHTALYIEAHGSESNLFYDLCIILKTVSKSLLLLSQKGT